MYVLPPARRRRPAALLSRFTERVRGISFSRSTVCRKACRKSHLRKERILPSWKNVPETLIQNRILKLDRRDNVMIALTDLRAGEDVSLANENHRVVTDVPAKHKFALKDFAPGDQIIMYGVVVGKATQPIRKGEVITTRNIRHEASDFHEKSENYTWHAPDVSRWKNRTFLGYKRADGQVGTRNYWLVVPLVF